jgi:Ni/Co efflux regulator RcnB
MQNKLTVSVLAILCAFAGSPAMADDHHDHDSKGRDHNSHSRDHRGHDGRHDNGRHRGRDEHQSRGAGPRHDMYRGQRISNEYRSRQYVVNDWRGHRLSAPPRGYHWVQAGGDYALVAITTGVILQVFLNN